MSVSPASKQDSKSVELTDVVEYGVTLSINKESLSPKRNEGYYCREMDINRTLVTTALSVYCKSGDSVFAPVKCVDALGSTGVTGLIWKKYLGDDVSVYINDPHEFSYKLISENSRKNDLKVETLQKDPCILLHEIPFSFIFVDCHTDAAFYLDSIMRNIPKKGIVAISTKDDCALYGRTPETALRNYGGTITRTFYSKELAARLIIAGLIRAAAIHSKGLQVLCVLSVKSTITIIVQILKGPAQANACVSQVRCLLHCNMCEDRAFYPSSIYTVENPAKLLSCKCSETTPGKVAVNVGPIWCGHIYDVNFLRNMILHLPKFPWKSNLKELMETMLFEAWCPNQPEQKILVSLLSNPNCDALQGQSMNEEPPTKKLKDDLDANTVPRPSKPEPPFYFNLHKHCPKGPKMVKTGIIVSALQKAGFHASRTHFDPLGVRTSASLVELTEIISQVMA